MRGTSPLAISVSILLLAGCLGASEKAADNHIDESGSGVPLRPTTSLGPDLRPLRLEPGTVFEYTLTGPFALTPAMRLVVVTSGPEGHFLAALDRPSLIQDIIEGSPLVGHFSPDMNEWYDGEENHRFLDHPLVDGKGWSDGNFAYNATAKEIQLPTGPVPGFEVVAWNLQVITTVQWTPALGFYNHIRHETSANGLIWEAHLDVIQKGASNYEWYDYTSWGYTDKEQSPATVEVPAGTETVYLQAYGDDGSRFVSVSPSGKHEVFEPQGKTGSVLRQRDGEPGAWRLAGILPQDTDGTLWLVAVDWTDGAIATSTARTPE